MDWQRIDELQHALHSVRNSKFVTIGAVERAAGVPRGWCRVFLGGTPHRMRPNEPAVASVEAAINELRGESI